MIELKIGELYALVYHDSDSAYICYAYIKEIISTADNMVSVYMYGYRRTDKWATGEVKLHQYEDEAQPAKLYLDKLNSEDKYSMVMELML